MGEFDALPGLSKKELPVMSPVTDSAPGHGCGHNLLGSASALAAVAVKEEMQARGLKGTLWYFGTPAEECRGGKIYLIHAGLFRDVDAPLDWHPGDSNQVSLGSTLANNGALFRHGESENPGQAGGTSGAGVEQPFSTPGAESINGPRIERIQV